MACHGSTPAEELQVPAYLLIQELVYALTAGGEVLLLIPAMNTSQGTLRCSIASDA